MKRILTTLLIFAPLPFFHELTKPLVEAHVQDVLLHSPWKVAQNEAAAFYGLLVLLYFAGCGLIWYVVQLLKSAKTANQK
jgi:hypothetical protein